jgi:chromosome segregation ATPase
LNSDVLKTLVFIRKQREDAAMRVLNDAVVVLRAAQARLDYCNNALQTAIDQIASQNQLLQQSLEAGEISILEIKQHRNRIDLINDERLLILQAIQEATEKVAAAEQVVDECKKDYLRIRAKRDAAEAQIAQNRKRARALEEQRVADTVQELSVLVHT